MRGEPAVREETSDAKRTGGVGDRERAAESRLAHRGEASKVESVSVLQQKLRLLLHQ